MNIEDLSKWRRVSLLKTCLRFCIKSFLVWFLDVMLPTFLPWKNKRIPLIHTTWSLKERNEAFVCAGKADNIPECHVLMSLFQHDGVKLSVTHRSADRRGSKSCRAPSRVRHRHPAGDVWRFLRVSSYFLMKSMLIYNVVLYSGWSAWRIQGQQLLRGSAVLNLFITPKNKLTALTLTLSLLLRLFFWISGRSETITYRKDYELDVNCGK